MEIRLLTKDDIDVRVGQTFTGNNQVKVSLLLYKDARVDMKILDELFTPMGWKRSHKLIGDRLYCQVEVWDAAKKEWICKEDVGVESNTEAEKGQASDSFKRACVNWGIGRELYTAPRILVELRENEYTRDQNNKIRVWASFSVKSIGYDTNARTITSLVIQDRWGNERYVMGQESKPVAAKEPSQAVKARRAAAWRVVDQVMTKEQFRERWNSGDDGGGITYNDIADCAKSWGLFSSPKTVDIMVAKAAVLKAAGVQDGAYKPLSQIDYWRVIEKYAAGQPTKTGGDYRQTWIEMTNAGPEQIKKFDNDVEQYKVATH